VIVVADSSPLHYLILIEQVELLRHLYSEVVVPDAVVTELTRRGSPASVSGWFRPAPLWLRVMPANTVEIATVTESLGLGERAAIALAEAMNADLLLIDDAAGRREASRRSILVTGTLGVLRAAAMRGFIDVPDVLRRLRTTNFYVDETLIEHEFGRWLKR
jgi:predicted nucleic acid-binding protein